MKASLIFYLFSAFILGSGQYKVRGSDKPRLFAAALVPILVWHPEQHLVHCLYQHWDATIKNQSFLLQHFYYILIHTRHIFVEDWYLKPCSPDQWAVTAPDPIISSSVMDVSILRSSSWVKQSWTAHYLPRLVLINVTRVNQSVLQSAISQLFRPFFWTASKGWLGLGGDWWRISSIPCI